MNFILEFFLKSLSVFAAGLLLLSVPFPASATGTDEESGRGVITGVITSEEDGEPILGASILIEDLNRGTTSHRDGDFVIRNVREGAYMLRIQHVSYESTFRSVTVTADDTTHIEISLSRGRFRAADVVVTGAYERDDQTTQVERVLTGRQLRLQLGQTIAETLDDEPGLAQRSMGPAPARPVIRGLGGDRLLILEDGGRTGDLSATASDHALAIEPMTAEHIELIRGPSALIHGSNTMGGVINVIRGQIPLDRPDHLHMSGTAQLQSVNSGAAGGLRLYGPLSESLAFRVDSSVRSGRNVNTPEGELINTGITTYNASAGLSLIRPWGVLGVSGNILDTKYGVPGGIGIVDAHPNGVDIEMFRRYAEFKGRIHLGSDFLRRLDADVTYSYYKHAELEKPDFETESRIVGSEFGVLTTNARTHLHHNSIGIINKGLFGVWGENRDYASGAFSETPATVERALAFYTFQEARPANWNLQLALRYDLRSVSPRRERDSFLIGQIRERNFGGFSGSFRAAYLWDDRLKTGITLMRAFRAPGIEELFSEGPHLANFSYEKGNPELGAETGFGAELFAEYQTSRATFAAAVFRNQMGNYIFPRDTNELATRRADLNKFIFEEQRVLMTGFELQASYRLTQNFKLSSELNFVRGDFIDDDESFPFIRTGSSDLAVPMMPPFSGRSTLEWARGDLRVGSSVRYAAAQNRVDRFETTTDGYTVFDAFAQYNLSTGSVLHTFTLNIENIGDTVYRNHLSRIKEIYPEPGINLRLLYRFYF